MFVDTGVPAFFRELQKAGLLKTRSVVKVAGGAQMNGGDFFAIGRRNYITLRKALWQLGVLISAEDVGGNMPRTFCLEVGSGRAWVSTNGHRHEI